MADVISTGATPDPRAQRRRSSASDASPASTASDTANEVTSARQVIGARGANAKEAEDLGEEEGAPLLTMERTGYAADGRVVEFGQHVYRPSLYSFHFSLFTS